MLFVSKPMIKNSSNKWLCLPSLLLLGDGLSIILFFNGSLKAVGELKPIKEELLWAMNVELLLSVLFES